MLIYILSGIVIVLGLFLAYASMKPKEFHFERSGVINASPEKIFPYISQLKLCGMWSTYEMRDPTMKKSYSGTDGAPGATMTFDGKSSSGTGRIEIISVKPNELAEFRLVMTKPFACDNIIRYSLKKENNGTRFTWSMDGENKFINKIMITLIDCDKMLDKDMNEGINNLKKITEQTA